MARHGKDTKLFSMSVWIENGQHLNTTPKVLVDKFKAGESVKGTFEFRWVDGKIKIVLERVLE